ncbi:unnamed protein product [Sphenostylis stenocarpa]|uniref:Uncharacterized protein n=1 Tax=Sphenostylis stenocarpa TaxID=92480 RepID=A0AA86T206_9FABA|nr:unnamed protein product [Sphenostylis stenocarpa]
MEEAAGAGSNKASKDHVTTNPQGATIRRGAKSHCRFERTWTGPLEGQVDKSIASMYKKLQKNLTSEELLPSLWDKCKKEFLDKYESFAQLVAKIYPTETIPSVAEMRDLLASM